MLSSILDEPEPARRGDDLRDVRPERRLVPQDQEARLPGLTGTRELVDPERRGTKEIASARVDVGAEGAEQIATVADVDIDEVRGTDRRAAAHGGTQFLRRSAPGPGERIELPVAHGGRVAADLHRETTDELLDGARWLRARVEDQVEPAGAREGAAVGPGPLEPDAEPGPPRRRER